MTVKTSVETSKDINKPEQLITEHIDIWTSAILAKSTSGRGSNKKYELYGITKLRELILELAVRGKLVPQDANDEPASVLLEKIAVEKAQLIKKKIIKKTKADSEVDEDKKPFELPKSWAWVKLNEIGTIGSSSRVHKRDWKEEGVPFYRAREIVKLSKGEDIKNELYISEELFEELALKGIVPEFGDIMITGVGTIGVPYVVKNGDRFYFKDASVLIFKNIFNVYPQFLCKLFKSNYWKKDIYSNSMGTTVHTLTITRANDVLIPLPPLAEQHRIVAKVDELMLLCDQLEQQTEASIEAHATLVEVLLATLTDSGNADELAQNWARIAEHFDSLFTTEQSIEALKQTVLQLAVMGKLVPQNPGDEPASVLLEKIAEEKEQLIKDKVIKKEKPLPAITDEEKLFGLPRGWKWCRIDSLSLSSEAGWSPKCDPTPKEGDNWGVLKVSAVTWGKYQPNENKALPNDLEPKSQYEVKAGDFLISRANTADLVARSVIVPKNTPEKLIMSDKIIRFKFAENLFSEYINLVNNSSYSRQYYAEVAGGTSSSMKNVSRSQVRALKIALPPLAEQARIVTKVDELMAICDQLKQKLQQSQETLVQLTDGLIDQALV